ncbi:MAG: hypothetical protein KC620_13685, partial [Myxococcales bacterium]|nr:hypothetical protein [Myxococcales bacterium]
MSETPPFDGRSEDELVAHTESLVSLFTAWRPSPPESLDLGGALIRLFGRMARHAVEHVDRAPDRYAEELFRLLGVRPVPPGVATAPLVFTAAEGAASDPVVPGKSGVSAAADDQCPSEAVFYTEADLRVLRSLPVAARVLVPSTDTLADPTVNAFGEGIDAWQAFAAEKPYDRALYIACDALLSETTYPYVRFRFYNNAASAPARWRDRIDALEWHVFDGTEWSPRSASVIERADGRSSVQFDGVLGVRPVEIAGVKALWVRCRPAAALSPGDAWPDLTAVRIDCPLTLATQAPDALMRGPFALDDSVDFAPLGETPAFNDALYIDGGQVFDQPAGATVKVSVTISDWKPAAAPSNDALIAWELRLADGWTPIGYSAGPGASAPASSAGFSDGTARFTASGDVSFTLSGPVPEAAQAGVTGRWLRARLVRGNFGESARIEVTNGVAAVVDATLAPPWLSRIRLAASVFRVMRTIYSEVITAL